MTTALAAFDELAREVSCLFPEGGQECLVLDPPLRELRRLIEASTEAGPQLDLIEDLLEALGWPAVAM